MKDSFAIYCSGLIGQYNNNMKKLVDDSTNIIFNKIINPSNQVKKTINNEILIGKFYLIKYDYNGNKLWCPILVIDDRYNTQFQKRIIYALNLDYLPFKYKIIYFDKLLNIFSSIYQKNINIIDNENDVNSELPFKINFESIYKTLKDNGGFNYAITAFDYNKIVGVNDGNGEIYGISNTILSRFIFLNTKIINGRMMMEILKDNNIEKNKDKIKEILKNYEKTIFQYDNDVKEYYQKLKLLENSYKLHDNI